MIILKNEKILDAFFSQALENDSSLFSYFETVNQFVRNFFIIENALLVLERYDRILVFWGREEVKILHKWDLEWQENVIII